MLEKRFIPATELRVSTAGKGKAPVITGYAAVFNTRSQALGSGKEKFVEVIAPGAFTRALSEGQDVRAMFDHSQILARTKNGTLKLTQDDVGLRFEATINPADSEAMAVAARIQRGDVDGCSFAFRTKADDWSRDSEGMPLREVRDVDLFDVGPVVYPAYEQTSVDVRSVSRELAKLPKPEARATIEVEDDSLIYVCRSAIQYSRYAFDAFQRVIDIAGQVTGALSEADQTAINDCVDNLADVIGKARMARAALDAMGAEDEEPEDAPADTATRETDFGDLERQIVALAI